MTPPPPTTIEPMPCPFCGKSAHIYHTGKGVDIRCNNNDCEIQPKSWAWTERDALEQWNRRPTPQPTREAALWNPSYADIEAVTAFVLSIDEHSSAIRNNMPFAVIEVKRDRVFIAASIAYPAIKRALAAAPKPEPTEAVASLVRSRLFQKFIEQGFWHAHHVDLVWRMDGKEVREEADWLKDLWYFVRGKSHE